MSDFGAEMQALIRAGEPYYQDERRALVNVAIAAGVTSREDLIAFLPYERSLPYQWAYQLLSLLGGSPAHTAMLSWLRDPDAARRHQALVALAAWGWRARFLH